MEPKERLVFLDIFAAIGILLVVLHHLSTLGNQRIASFLRIFLPLNAGNLGVLYFLFRSGFGLYNSKKDSWADFYRRRFLKIIPPLFVTISLSVLISIVIFKRVVFIENGSISLKIFLANAFGVQNLLNITNLMGGASWFISVILLFYLLFPFIYNSGRKTFLFWINSGLLILLMFLIQKIFKNYLPQLHYYFIVFLIGFICAKYAGRAARPKYLHIFAAVFIIYVAVYYHLLINNVFFFSNGYISMLRYINDIFVVLNSYYLFAFINFSAIAKRAFAIISDYSYYIFIIHMPLLFFLAQIRGTLVYLSAFILLIMVSCTLLKVSDSLIQGIVLKG